MHHHLINLLSNFAACPDTSKFGIPTWYKYLDAQEINGDCRLLVDANLTDLDSLLGIGLAAVEILLFFAGIIAVAFIVYGGFRYVLSQGEPENTTTAKNSILNAVIGLVIALLASAIVRFVGNSILST